MAKAQAQAPQVISMDMNIKSNKYTTERDRQKDLQNLAHVDARHLIEKVQNVEPFGDLHE